MRKEFFEKVIRFGSIDTRKYRYVCKELPDRMEIRRIELSALDTTAAIDGWETVMIIK